jgi:SPP1 family predicted phage head-tail adaptor
VRNKISIIEPVYYNDDEHSQSDLKPIEEWPIILSALASYRDLSGDEFFSSQKENSRLTGEFKIRYRPDIKASYKVVWGNRVFDIKAARDIEGTRMWLYINVEEIDYST